jgi:hypothetical protein
VAIKESIVNIKKNNTLESYRIKAGQELKLLRNYKRWRLCLSVIVSFVVVYWFIDNFYFDIQYNPWLLVPLWAVCVLMAAGIDNLLCYYYNGVIQRKNLDVDNFESGSFKKFSTEIKNLVQIEMEKQGQSRYSVYDMTVTEDEYSCKVLVWSEK